MRESTGGGGIFPGAWNEQILAAEGGAPPNRETLCIYNSLAHSCTPIIHFYWKEGRYSQLKPNINKWFTEVVTDGYWRVLWKENYVAWIALEPWLNACPCMPLTCEVWLTSNEIEEVNYITIWPLFLYLLGVRQDYYA